MAGLPTKVIHGEQVHQWNGVIIESETVEQLVMSLKENQPVFSHMSSDLMQLPADSQQVCVVEIRVAGMPLLTVSRA